MFMKEDCQEPRYYFRIFFKTSTVEWEERPTHVLHLIMDWFTANPDESHGLVRNMAENICLSIFADLSLTMEYQVLRIEKQLENKNTWLFRKVHHFCCVEYPMWFCLGYWHWQFSKILRHEDYPSEMRWPQPSPSYLPLIARNSQLNETVMHKCSVLATSEFGACSLPSTIINFSCSWSLFFFSFSLYM